MDDEKRVYELIQKYYEGAKSNILEIGAANCSLINLFIIKGYESPVALDKGYMQPEQCFLTYKLHKNDISYIENKNSIVLNDLNFKEISLANGFDIDYTINTEYKEEFKNYRTTYYDNFINTKDFFDYSPNNRFNIILCSFVFHLYQPEEDTEILEKIKDLSDYGGILYVKVHNMERLQYLEKGEEIIENSIVKNSNYLYPFDKKRLDSYKKNFNCLYERTNNDKTEMILQNIKD